MNMILVIFNHINNHVFCWFRLIYFYYCLLILLQFGGVFAHHMWVEKVINNKQKDDSQHSP